MKYLLVTPPFVQLNTPYPATSVLKAWLKEKGHDVMQCDLGIEVADRIFCRSFLEELFERAFQKERLSTKAKAVALLKKEYLSTIDSVWRFLKGKDDTLANRIAVRGFLPEATQFKKLKDEDLEWAYGTTSTRDKALHFATIYIEDLADFIAGVLGCDFSVIRYEEQISISAPKYDYIYARLKNNPVKELEAIAIELFDKRLREFSPDIIAFTIPFPGTLMMAMRLAEYTKSVSPDIVVAMGGGYVNTELRDITDVKFFEDVDFLLYDDGELPLETLAGYVAGSVGRDSIVRAKYVVDGVVEQSSDWSSNVAFDELPSPDFSDLDLDSYISLVEFTNPMHKLWSEGRWNKLTVAHGCYWAKCAFCDTHLDYIGRYDAPKAVTVVKRMKDIIAQTGNTGFHFTDEALPPKLLREMCEIIISEGLVVTFWGNIRFEKSYNAEFAELLARAGCIAVSGGLEVASPRILKLINKGVTIEQAVKCCTALNEAGIMVHAYLMYGFPSQTAQEAVESLEIVRQMFEEGIVQSAFWHRYAMTIHSPSGRNPELYGAEKVCSELNPFSNNAVEFIDNADDGIDWKLIGKGMASATQNYMLGKGYDHQMRNWFNGSYDNPPIKKNYIARIIDSM